MVFSSMQFVFIFLPIFFIIYYLVPNCIKNAVLLMGSLCFYLVGTLHNPEHFILFLISIIVDFKVGLLIHKYERYKKVFLSIGILFHLICLITFKYSEFVLGELNRLFPSLDAAVDVMLPIGISFYTFQGVSYIIDVYRGAVPVEKSLLKYAVYISMFEQLIAGPIVTYSQVRKELNHRRISPSAAGCGIGTFVLDWG